MVPEKKKVCLYAWNRNVFDGLSWILPYLIWIVQDDALGNRLV